jgi:hypothetical protein
MLQVRTLGFRAGMHGWCDRSLGLQQAPRETPAVVVAEYEFTTTSNKTGPMIHQLFVGRLVTENDQIKLPREFVNFVNWLRY